MPGDEHATRHAVLVDALAALLRGDRVAWAGLDVSPAEFVAACAAEDLVGLIEERLRTSAVAAEWPRDVRDELAARARADIARELCRQRELIRVFDALRRARLHPVLFKGAALAYCCYGAPSHRPRLDTDLLIRGQDVDATRDAMSVLGYAPLHQCEGEFLFRQFTIARDDQWGVAHVFDIHWKISTQSAFADLFTHDELVAHAVPVPALGTSARAAGPLHALLLACVHPVMHHRNVERLIWVYDIHLLASGLPVHELERFAALAVAKGIGPICAHGLALARSRFGTAIPAHVESRLLSTGNDALTEYLSPGRGWRHDFLSNLRGLHRWRDRLQFIREMLFPGGDYMIASYRLKSRAMVTALLPALYLHRNVRGLWQVLAGRK